MITKIGTKIVLSTKREDDSYKNYAMMASAPIAGGFITDAISSGDFTGRRTLYHGTLGDNIPSILNNGLNPTSDKNAINTKALKVDPERYVKSLGKSYMTKNRLHAMLYAASAQKRKDIKRKMSLSKREPFRLGIEDLMANKVNTLTNKEIMDARNNVVKLNVPLWKHKQVINPEVDMPYEEWAKRSNVDHKNPISKQMYKQLRDAVVVEGGISPEYIAKSSKYIRNSPKEYFQYVKKMPRRALLGAGKFGLGLGLLGLAGTGAYNQFKNHD